MSYNIYGANKFGDRFKHAGIIDDELNMNGIKITGLPTYIGDLIGEGGGCRFA